MHGTPSPDSVRPTRAFAAWLFGLATAVAAPAAMADLVVFQASGSDAASITSAYDAFRAALGGGTTAGAGGSFGGLRREINWDGVPDALAAPNLLPADFFNVDSPRGVVLSTSGTGLEVSANAGALPPIQFGDIDASYPSTFESFSAQRLFTAVGGNVVDVSFFLPGTTTPALTTGFGVVFSDVDLANVTSITYFDALGASLGTFHAPNVVGDETFSFLGVRFDSAIVASVRIVAGNGALGTGVPDGGAIDLVVMDDFVYGEPVARAASVDAPASLPLLAVGAAALAGSLRRRARGHRPGP
jgi:hypothetical protein